MHGQTSPLRVRDRALTPPSGNDLEIELEELIFSEWANPGDRLPSERALSDHFRVSRPLLRETLRALEGRGLIRIEAGRGTFIEDLTQVDPTRILSAARQGSITPAHLIQARLMIECSAAAQAAQFRSIEDLDALKLSLYEMHNSKDAQVHANADMDFHLRIVTASQNPVTQLVYGSIKNLVFGLMTRSATDNTVTKEGLPLHDDVYQAIADKDAVLAEQVMRKIILVCQEHYGADLNLPLSTVLNRRAKSNPEHKVLLTAASKVVRQPLQSSQNSHNSHNSSGRQGGITRSSGVRHK